MSTAEKLDWLTADQLKAELTGAVVIGREIIVLEQTGSTNDAILQHASAHGAESRPSLTNEGLVLFAEQQTAGRGRRGNRWESTKGKGLWFSILLRPWIQLRDSGRLTIWAVEAISDAIYAGFGAEPTIKLPNDIQLSGRKVAGVLVEMRAQKNAPHIAVVGVGINVNQARGDFPVELQDRATSLAMALGREIDRHKFAVALLRNLDLTYREKFSKTAVAKGADPGSEAAHTKLPRSTPAATISAARTTTGDKPAARFQTV